MKGSIDKYTIKGASKPRWRYRIYTGKDAAGKKTYIAAAGFAKEGEASDAMRDKMKELGNPAVAPAVTETFGDYLSGWLDRSHCQPKTLERYRQLAGYVFRSELAERPVAELKARHIEPVLYGLLKAPAVKRKHLSVKTVHHIASVMRSALQDAFRLETIDVNPMLRVKLPPVEKSEKRLLSRIEIDALLTSTLDC